MKQTILRMLSCLILAVSATVGAQAANGIIETKNYKICPGDTIKITVVNPNREVIVYKDTIWTDTIPVVDPSMDSVYRFVVNVYPRFEKTEFKELEVGQTISWCGMTITQAGSYERRYQSQHGCDSIHRLVVTEHVYTTVEHFVVDTLCQGDSKSFGGQMISESGVYRDTIHLSHYDSIVVLTMNVMQPDTTIAIRRIPEGESLTWNGNTYSTTGVYDKAFTNRFGCDSLVRLQLTVYHIDTIDTTVVLRCPQETLTWHGMTYSQSGEYAFPGVRDNGDQVYYRLHLTATELVQVDTLFTLCDNESVTFNGKTYVNAGQYDDQYTCDTLYRITITKYPTQLHLQTGVLDRTHPYYWQYTLDGEQKTDTIYQPGMYEHTTHNYTTGCNDIWRLILTRDETSFHYVENVTICESEDYDWHGLTNLNKLGVGQTIHYYDRHRTVSDQDSVYELVLTVKPVVRTTRTVPFCGSIVWDGTTYTASTTVVDTLTSAKYGCDSIVTTFLVKGLEISQYDSISILDGETLHWHGQTIVTAGDYQDVHHSSLGCDSSFYLHVELKEPAHTLNTHSDWYSICQGDEQVWRNKTYYNSGTYYDTIKTAGGEIDSLYILYLTVNKRYEWSERITFLTFPQTYREQTIPSPGEYIFTYHSTFGCDSIIHSYIDQEVYRDEQTVVICPGETHIWDYDGETYTVSGKYTKVEQNQAGNDSVIHVLNLTVRYIPETLVEKTICEGQTYIFGDQSLTQSGVYRYTFHKTGGCDSTVVLSLNVLRPDTTYLAIQRTQGSTYVWDTETITKPGTYFHYGTNRFGCDSVSVLEFTYNQIDTIADTLTVCPNELPFRWNGIEANQSGHFTKLVKQPAGNYIFYSLQLTVRDIVQVDTTFSMCADASLSFNGKTYTEAGHYRDYLSCDTMVNITIVKYPQQVYETRARITDDHGYTWTYWDNGAEYTKEFNTADTWEFESPNATTGCSEIWRLILTKDETSYHFVEELTICEGDDFSWRGLGNLSSITGTNTYFENLTTHAGKDSIYELRLTVVPVERTVRTIVFCGSTTWNGKTYSESTVIYDTISLATGCYRIERINLDKESSFYHTESKELPQGTVLHWHGQNITTDGTYYDYNTTVNGCDSTYEITVTIIPAAPQNNQYAEELSTCEGDTIVWRGKDIWRSGVYVDTVYKAGTQNVDSIFTLHFTVWPAPKDTIYQHLYTCNDGSSIRYNGKDYYQNDTVVTTFHTIHGCDSIVKVYLHFNTALYHRDTAKIAENHLPYAWSPVSDTTIMLDTPGTYQYTRKAEGGCNNVWELVLEVYPVFILRDTVSVCEADLPYHWMRGPIEHRNDDLSAAPGETRMISYNYQSVVTGADSTYILYMTVLEQPKRIEQHFFCEGEDITVYGKHYYMTGSESVVRDTIRRPNPDMQGCDSAIYLEIYQTALVRTTETMIKHVGEDITWDGETFSEHRTETYTHITPNATTGCDDIKQLRVVAEQRETEYICVVDTASYEWHGLHPRTSGLYTDTVYDAQGFLTEYYSLDLHIDTVAIQYEYYYVCIGEPQTIYGHTYGDDPLQTDYVDEFITPGTVPGNTCSSEIHVVVTVTTAKKHEQTVVLLEGESLDWNQYHITQGGEYRDTTLNPLGCDSISILYVVAEHRKEVTICTIDTAADVHPDKKYPYVWITPRGKQDTLYVSGIYTDTVFNALGFIEEYNTLHLTVTQPYDTTVVIHGCSTYGAYWRDQMYTVDTTFVDRVPVTPYTPDAPCDSVFHVNIVIDTAYTITRFDTICEHQLPYIIDQGKKDSIYYDGWLPTKTYQTVSGCDSIVNIHLTIIPDFDIDGSDSIFVCEEAMPMYIGDTVHPAFDPYREKVHEWYGKWIGVRISNDTVLYNCGKVDSLHIIMRPHQAHIPVYEYSLCQGDSVQLFWPHKDTWIKEPGDYTDTVVTISAWEDMKHHTIIHNDRAYECDSIVTWKVRYADTLHVHLYEHIREGDIYHFNDSILTTTGVYDSIGYHTSMDSAHNYCKAVYTLHLTVDPVYRYGDTIEICHLANREYTHAYVNDDLNEHFAFKFQTPNKDTAIIHLTDSLQHLSYGFYDHFYDLVVYYKQQYFTQYNETICYGDSVQFDRHSFAIENNTTVERYLKEAGTYRDTLQALNGCDSIIELRLVVRDRIIIDPQSALVTDRELPYEWTHTWREPGATQDTTHIDSLYVSGDYTYTMPNAFGCDSTVVLHFTVHPTHVFRDSIDICAFKETTHTHVWATGYEQQFTVPTVDDTISYADTLITFYPLDSIYVLFVNYREQTITYLDSTLCYGDSMQFGLTKSNMPRFLNKSGVYRDTLVRTFNGCDSIIELRLNVFPRYFNAYTTNVSIDETPYVWYHIQGSDTIARDSLRATGEYVFHYTTSYGCDSIDSLSLRVHQTYLYRDTVQICQSETPYEWEGIKDIYTTGEYVRYLQTHDGYDSTHVRFVRVMPVKYDTITATICEGDSLRFGLTKSGLPRYLTLSGLYNDTLTTVHGCDSIITLSLNFYPKYLKHHQVDIADVDTPYIWYHVQGADTIAHDTLRAQGEYRYVFQTIPFGCDSIDSLSLRIHPTYVFHDSVTICYDATPYTWYAGDGITVLKNDIYETGNYVTHLQTVDGYDSTLVRYVRVIPVLTDTVRHTICEGSDFLFNGVRYTESGTYKQTLRSSEGCDSIVTLLLTVSQPYYVRIPVDIYEGDSYTFFGETYSTSGTYRHYGQTPAGCDSITELFLQVHPQIDTTVILCESELPYIWINKWTGRSMPLYAEGVYRNDTAYVNGQRTFYTIQLLVNKAVYDTVRVAICQGSSYLFKGEHLTQGGIYRDTTRANNGCDSVTTLVLTVNEPYFNTRTEHIIEGNEVAFFGQSYNTTGTYYHYGKTPEGCDSTSVLQLVVHPAYDTLVTVCSTELPYLWVNKWNGQVTPLYAAGTYRNDTTYVQGERMFYGLKLVVTEPTFDTVRVAICQGSSYLFKGEHLTTAGIYRDTTRANNGCDSVTTLVLTVNEPYFNTRTEHIIEGNEVEFFGQSYNTTGTYYHYGKTPEGCDSTSVLQLVVHPAYDTLVTVCSTELPYLWVNKWNGQVTPLYAAGTYRNDTTYVQGERMFYGLKLIVTEPTDTTLYREICEGDLYNFNNRFLGTSGEYRDTIKNYNGCDSVVILHLNVLKKYYNSIDRTIYEGDTVMFQGIPYSTAGIYPVRLTSSYGCDSIIELRLTVLRLFDDSISVCANDLPLVWRNKNIYESGIYRDTTIVEGQTVVTGLKVNVLPIVHAAEPINAVICEGDFYKFGDSILTEQGTYYDTLVAANGCDSIVMLALQVMPINHQITTRTIYEGDTVLFHGTVYTTSGIYTYTEHNANGCIDTYQLILTVLKEFRVDTTAYVCQNELPFLWRGYEYYETGNYTLPTAWNDSSRVVTTLHLTVQDYSFEVQTVDMCFGSTFIYKTDKYNTDTIFHDTIPTLVGCDSIIKYVVRFHPTYERWDTVHISDTQVYPFKTSDSTTRILTIPGDYEYTGRTYRYGCDSIVHLHLEVHSAFDSVEYRTICAPDTIHWRGKVISMDTVYKVSPTVTQYGKDATYIYQDKYLTRYGFDSIYELHVIVHPSYLIYEQIAINEGETTTIHGIDISQTGKVYTDVLHTVYGCDSTYQIAVNTKRMIDVYRDITICEGTYYDLYGVRLSETGSYSQISTNGDTVVHVNLTVNPITHSDTTIVITEEDLPFFYAGRFYTRTDLPKDDTPYEFVRQLHHTVTGCDSLAYTEIIRTSHYSPWYQFALCKGSKLFIDDVEITHAGRYQFKRRRVDPNDPRKSYMDSLYRVEVYDAPTYNITVERTICQGDSFMFDNKYLTETGVYKMVGTTLDGCDSIVTLNLTVTPAVHYDEYVRVWPENLPYFWTRKSEFYYGSGDYADIWYSNDCANSYTLHLTVVETDTVTTDMIICNGDSYQWRGQTYTETGKYTDLVIDNVAMTKTLYVLNLEISSPITIVTAYADDVCADDNELVVHFTYQGKKPYMYSVLFDADAKANGLQDARDVLMGNEEVARVALPQYAHPYYIRPNYYNFSLVLDNGVCGNGRMDNIRFLVKYPSWIIEQNWNDVVAPLNAERNGGYEFSDTRWYINNTFQSGTMGYLHSDQLQAGDEVYMEARRKGENTYIPSCPITITKWNNGTEYPVILSPSYAPKHMPTVSIVAPKDGTYDVYSSTGTLLFSGSFVEGTTPITLPSVNGIYFIRTHVGEQHETHKAVIF